MGNHRHLSNTLAKGRTFKKDKQSEDEKSEVIDFKDQFSRGTEVYRKSMKSARHR